MEKIGRNAPCPCGSGNKYKKCCLQKDEEKSLEGRNYQKSLDRDNEELFEDEMIPDEDYENYEDNIDKEDYFPDDDLENDDDLEEYHPPDKVSQKKISDELPEISEKEDALIDDWYKVYKNLEGPDELRRHLEDFMDKYPELVVNLEMHQEVLFEIGARYVRQDKHKEYIDLLTRIRNDFPESYKKSYGYFDRDNISYMLMTDQKDRISRYLENFREYPDHDPDNLFKLIDLLSATNCQEIIIPFVRNIYYDVCTSIEIIYGEDILDDVLLSYFIPYLKSDFSEQDMENLADQLKEIKIPLNDNYMQPDFLKEEFEFIFKKAKDWHIKDCITNHDIHSRYHEITRNFMSYLHERTNMDWMAANFYSKMVLKYLYGVIPEGKRPKEAFVFTKNKIENTIIKTCNDVFSLYSTATLGMLNSIWYFAGYLEETDSINKSRKDKIQQWCKELFDRSNTFLAEESFAAKVFKRFPYFGATR